MSHFCTRWRTTAMLAAVFCAWPLIARADIVRLSNGRTMSIDSCRFEAEIVSLVMKGGGEVTAPKSLVDEVLPDEIPQSQGRTQAIAALADSPTAVAPKPTPGAIRQMVDRVAAKVGLDSKLAHAVV